MSVDGSAPGEDSYEAAAVEDGESPREQFMAGIFDLSDKYGLPLTNNESRTVVMEVVLHDIGDFIGDVEDLVRRTLLKGAVP